MKKYLVVIYTEATNKIQNIEGEGSNIYAALIDAEAKLSDKGHVNYEIISFFLTDN